MKKTLFIIFATLLIGCQSGNKKNNNKIKSDSLIKKQIIDSIPVFLEGFLYDNVDGGKFTFETVKGKVLLLDFWSTRCRPCIKEHPEIVKLKKTINHENFQVIAISTDRETERWKKFIKENHWQGINLNINSFKPTTPLHKMIFKPLIRKGDTIYSATLPTYYLIDKELNVIKLDSINERNLETKINNLLKE